MTVVNLGEAMYGVQRRIGLYAPGRALIRLNRLHIDVVDIDRDLAIDAASIKATRSMGYMDCFAVALARRLSATVVTGDRDFLHVLDLVPVDWLPEAQS